MVFSLSNSSGLYHSDVFVEQPTCCAFCVATGKGHLTITQETSQANVASVDFNVSMDMGALGFLDLLSNSLFFNLRLFGFRFVRSADLLQINF